MFAAACGLHALSPSKWSTSKPPSLLPLPRSRAEIQRRSRVWWTIFTLNRLGSAATNVDSDFDDEKIETTWDLPPESGDLEDAHSRTISLFVRDSRATYVYDDTANVIRSKCAALVECAARIGFVAVLTPESDRAFWNQFQTIDQAIQRVTNSLPSIFEEPRYDAGAPHVVSNARMTNQYTIVPHALVCDAVISLHGQLARAGNVVSRDACLRAS